MQIEVNGINLYYEKHGNGHPLILVHGNGETHEIFNKIIEPLSHHFTVYAIDSRAHGYSKYSGSLSYNDMADDIYKFIHTLNIQKPYFYGFSDGGIIGLILASQYPLLLSKLIISGANSSPDGIKAVYRALFCVMYFFNRDDRIKLMLKEPHISKEDLDHITIPTLILAGSRDVIKLNNTMFIAKHIKNSNTHILKGETHSSYVINSSKLAPIITKFCNNNQ